MRICSGAGCLRAVADDVRFCDECKPQIIAPDDIRSHTLTDRERYHFLYSSARWTKLRTVVARSQPYCAVCQNKTTAIVDHIIPAGVAIVQAQESKQYMDKWAGFFIRSNLQGLCHVCHIQKTIGDKAHCGAWPSVVSESTPLKRRSWSFG